MNSISTFGIFIVLLFAYYTPTQGQAIAVSDVAFENGERYKSTKFIRTPDGAYKIEKRDGTFGIEGIDTIVGNNVVLRTSDNSYIQMSLVNSQDSRQLFSMTTGSKLGQILYSFKVSLHKYKEGLISDDLLLSGFEYSTTGEPQPRFVIHSGKARSTELTPLLLWTGQQFNFLAWFNSVILVLRVKPAEKTDEYYLVTFRNSTYLRDWMDNYGRSCTNTIDIYPKEVYDYFHEFMTAYYYK